MPRRGNSWPPRPSRAADDYIGYYEPYATSHQELDAALVNAVKLLRAGGFVVPDAGIHESRPK
ncbi:MAG TPA: hypothetical protein VN930_03270 [Xanthobacteraceae bacterium]|nr:hypothetical protein [Xanthobacteraceae bacterium]